MTLGNVADARLVLGFAPDEAVLSREGDSLVFSFEDGETVNLSHIQISRAHATSQDLV